MNLPKNSAKNITSWEETTIRDVLTSEMKKLWVIKTYLSTLENMRLKTTRAFRKQTRKVLKPNIKMIFVNEKSKTQLSESCENQLTLV